MNCIPYIATDRKIGKTLESYFLQHNFELKPLGLPSPNPLDIKGTDILLVVSPFKCNNIYISAEAIWKRYLNLNSPDTILLTAGFKAVTHSNYLDLLQLPSNPHVLLSSAKAAADKWEPPFSGGLNIAEKLRRFYQGHGDDSVTDVLHTIIRIFSIADVELKQYQTSFDELKENLFVRNGVTEKWRELKNRWINYTPFFQCLPFWNVFANVDQLFEQMDPFFAADCAEEVLFWELHCLETLKQIKDQLATICNQYVY